MNKREYFRDRNRIIKKYEKGEINYSEFLKLISDHATNFKERWSKEWSATGKLLGSKMMKTKEGETK